MVLLKINHSLLNDNGNTIFIVIALIALAKK